jgi:hypothetical protein
VNRSLADARSLASVPRTITGSVRRVVALVLVLVSLVACSGGDDDDDAPDDGDSAPTTETTVAARAGGRLVVGLEDEVSSLDPAAGVLSASGMSVALAIFEPLLAVRSDGEVVPYLAASFEGNDDDTRWTIGLREGVTFADDTPLDAAAVVGMFDRLLTSTAMQQLVRPLRSVSAIGPLAVVLETEPWPELPELLAGQLGLVPSPTMPDPRTPIGTGPFVITQPIEGDRQTLRRNPTWWRAEEALPIVDELELRAVPSAADRVAQLARGELDAIHVSGEEAIDALRDADGVTVTEPGDSTRALVAISDPALACVADGGCDEDLTITVRTDQPAEAVDPVVERWEDDGAEVTVERVDAATLAADRLLGDVEIIVTVDDGLLPVGRLDGSSVTRSVLEPIAWAYGSGEKVGGVLGSLRLPDDDGETRAVTGVLVPAALHRTR